MSSNRTLIPIYTTKGDCQAFLIYPHLFNANGEWIGWVTPERDVFSVHGQYVGWLSNEPRVLRKRSGEFNQPRRHPPTAPHRVSVPARFPLAPLMPELSFDTIDVLEDDPDLLPSLSSGIGQSDLD